MSGAGTCEDIRVETRGLASWISRNRPEAMNAVRPRTRAELARYRNREGAATPMVGAIMDCTRPTIAAVNGAAVGSIGGTCLLPRSIGLSRVMELLLSGELLTAEQALAMGIVSRVVRKGMTLDPAALEAYGRLVSDERWCTEDHREGAQSHVDHRKPGIGER